MVLEFEIYFQIRTALLFWYENIGLVKFIVENYKQKKKELSLVYFLR